MDDPTTKSGSTLGAIVNMVLKYLPAIFVSENLKQMANRAPDAKKSDLDEVQRKVNEK